MTSRRDRSDKKQTKPAALDRARAPKKGGGELKEEELQRVSGGSGVVEQGTRGLKETIKNQV